MLGTIPIRTQAEVKEGSIAQVFGMQGKNQLEKVHLLVEEVVRCISYRRPAVSCSWVTAQRLSFFLNSKTVKSAERCLLSHAVECTNKEALSPANLHF